MSGYVSPETDATSPPEKAPQDRNVSAPRLQAGDVHTAGPPSAPLAYGVFLPEMPPPASPRNSIEALIAVEY